MVGGDPLWFHVFAYAVYPIFLVVAWLAYRKDGLFYAGVLLIFAIYFFISELGATQGALSYQYGALPHTICTNAFWAPIWLDGFVERLGQFVYGSPDEACRNVPACLPPSVPLMEAALVFGFLRTAMLLSVPRWLQPPLVGLVCVLTDAALDPTFAVSEWCGDEGCTPTESNGLRFWTWYPHDHYAPNWLGIPLINYGAWYLGPFAAAAAVALVTLRFGIPFSDKLAPARKRILPLFATLLLVLLLGLALEKMVFDWMGTLFKAVPHWVQWLFVLGLAFGTAGLVWRFARNLDKGLPLRWEWFPMPGLLFLVMSVGLFQAGPHPSLMVLSMTWIATLVALTIYLLFPRRD